LPEKVFCRQHGQIGLAAAMALKIMVQAANTHYSQPRQSFAEFVKASPFLGVTLCPQRGSAARQL